MVIRQVTVNNPMAVATMISSEIAKRRANIDPYWRKGYYGRLCRGVAQPGSATALGAVGRGFKSLHPDQYNRVLYFSGDIAGCCCRSQIAVDASADVCWIGLW